MKKSKLLNVSVVDNTGIRVLPSMLIGDYAGYASGDILDANATSLLISNKIQNSGSNQTSGDIENNIKELQSSINTLSDRVNGITAGLSSGVTNNTNNISNNSLRISALEEKALPDTIIVEEDGLYQSKGFDVYPLSHPDLSTQPSILPQRFGKEKIYEVLVTTKQEKLISAAPTDSSNMPSYTISGPIGELLDQPQYGGGQVSADASITLGYYSGLLAFVDNEGNAVTSSGGWILLGNPSYLLAPLTPKYQLIAVYPLYDDVYPGCFRYFIYSLMPGDDLYYAKIVVSDDGPWEAENTTFDEIANAGVNVYTATLDPEIPSTATIIEASSFNSEACVPAICKKENGKWNITNNEGITPDFTLVRYIGEAEDYYYENSSSSSDSGDYGPTIIRSFNILGSNAEWPTEMNVSDIWGDENLVFEPEQIIGKAIVNNDSNNYYNLNVIKNGSSVQIGAYYDTDTFVLLLDLIRASGYSPDVKTAPPYVIHIDFYAV